MNLRKILQYPRNAETFGKINLPNAHLPVPKAKGKKKKNKRALFWGKNDKPIRFDSVPRKRVTNPHKGSLKEIERIFSDLEDIM